MPKVARAGARWLLPAQPPPSTGGEERKKTDGAGKAGDEESPKDAEPDGEGSPGENFQCSVRERVRCLGIHYDDGRLREAALSQTDPQHYGEMLKGLRSKNREEVTETWRKVEKVGLAGSTPLRSSDLHMFRR